MKVIHILPNHSNKATGGTEIYILNLAKQLISSGHEIVIVSPSNNAETETFTVEGILVIASPAIQKEQSRF